MPFLNAVRGGLAPLSRIDRPAMMLVWLAIAAGLIAFFALPADPARLAQFASEQVAAFSITDSSPQRRALLIYLGLLLVGAVVLRFLRPARPLAGPGWLLIAALAVIVALQGFALAQMLRATLRLWPVLGSSGLAVFVGYALAGAAFIWHRALPTALLAALIVLGVVLAWWPVSGGAMHHVSAVMLPWVDQHMAAVFSGGDMLASGFRFFADVPSNYGILTPLALGALVRAGVEIDLLHLVHLVEAFQALTLLLFLAAAWTRSAGGTVPARLATLLLLLLVTWPFLSMASQAVLLPNQSGYRFVMFPLAVLCLSSMARQSLIRASVLAGAVAGLALLHNLETGIAVTAGLGFAWLLTARQAPWGVRGVAFAVGLVAALAMLALPILLHLAATGIWPPLDIASGMGLFMRFGEGFGGLAPPLRATVIFVLCHAGYVFVRAAASLLGRREGGAEPACAGIAVMIIAWSPYYANRPDDWNFWTFLALEVLLLAPLLAAGLSQLGRAGIALILLVPNSAMAALNNQIYLRQAAAMPVVEACAAGLSLAPRACAEQQSRATELRRAGSSGDVLWITGYPYLTWELTGLRPRLMPLDLYAIAITEADIDILAVRIAASRPRAILIDGVPGSVIGDAIPAPMRALHRRIATAAGFRACASASLEFWEVWRPAGACTTGKPVAAASGARLAGG